VTSQQLQRKRWIKTVDSVLTRIVFCRVLKQQRIQELTDILIEIDETIAVMSDVMLTITNMTCDIVR
jgi:hypothetical protein